MSTWSLFFALFLLRFTLLCEAFEWAQIQEGDLKWQSPLYSDLFLLCRFGGFCSCLWKRWKDFQCNPGPSRYCERNKFLLQTAAARGWQREQVSFIFSRKTFHFFSNKYWIFGIYKSKIWIICLEWRHFFVVWMKPKLGGELVQLQPCMLGWVRCVQLVSLGQG